MTLRALAVGVIGVIALCIVTPYFDLVQQGSRIVANHLPIGVMFLFLVFLVIVNPVIGWLRRRSFTRAEIAVALIMVMVASSVPGIGYATIMLPLLIAPSYFATPENKWIARFGEYIPSWFVPHGENVGKWFYEGLPAHHSLPWHAWLGPLGVWAVYALLFWGSYFFLGCLLRKQWIEHERLTFPLAQVPLDIMGTSERPAGFTPFLRSAPMWLGFLIVFAFHGTNSLHTYFGFFPEFKLTDIAIGKGFVSFPLNAWNTMLWNIYPSMIGIAFLLSSEIGFSLWFFYWFNKFQKLAIVASGLEGPEQVGGFSSTVFFRAQEAGAFAAVAFFFFWGARKQLGETLRASLRGQWDPKEPVAPHMALVWFAVCVALLGVFSVMAGMNWWAAVLTMVIFYVVAIGLTRMVSAGGTMYVECSFMPHDVVNNFLGMRGYGFRNMTVIQFPQRILMFNQEVTWWPYLMNSFKIAHHSDLRGRHVGAAVLIALLVAVPLSSYTALKLYYTAGGLELDRTVAQDGARWPFDKIASFIESPMEPSRMAIGATIFGAVFTLMLLSLNRNYLWWRLNPLAYIMGSTGTLEQIWLSVFIGWLISTLILRYSGLRMYRRLRPFFLGLLLGEFTAAAFWMIVDYHTGLKTHRIFP
jgi:hypothetical protein